MRTFMWIFCTGFRNELRPAGIAPQVEGKPAPVVRRKLPPIDQKPCASKHSYHSMQLSSVKEFNDQRTTDSISKKGLEPAQLESTKTATPPSRRMLNKILTSPPQARNTPTFELNAAEDLDPREVGGDVSLCWQALFGSNSVY